MLMEGSICGVRAVSFCFGNEREDDHSAEEASRCGYKRHEPPVSTGRHKWLTLPKRKRRSKTRESAKQESGHPLDSCIEEDRADAGNGS